MGETIDWTRYGAVLFDLDGVLTDTARIHSAAWKETFDHYLRRRADLTGTPFEPFVIQADYLEYVDGKPRFDGVDAFLRSRGIVLPWGDHSDPPGYETVCAVGNMKNRRVGEILEADGVDVYEGSVRLLEHLRGLSIPMAVVTSSANATSVLDSAGIGHFFEAQVDGNVAAQLGLRGKPHPDPFLEAARLLEVDPKNAVVVEDAISGVEAGRRGGFGLVIGVNRHLTSDANWPAALKQAGADLVVTDLAEVAV